MRPSRTAVSSASGTEAAEVLACWSTVTITFSGGRPSLRAVASRMRALAWCGTTQSTSAGVEPGGVEHLAQHRGEIDDGVAEHLRALHPQLADRAGGRGAAIDIEQVVVAPVGVEPGGEDAAAVLAVLAPSSTTAPAPSPNSTQVVRSSQSRMRLNVSAPITSA